MVRGNMSGKWVKAPDTTPLFGAEDPIIDWMPVGKTGRPQQV